MTTTRSSSAAVSQIVQSTIQLAHNLGLGVVTEGVETADTLSRLDALGYDEAQGYFLARPMPPDRLLDWLVSSPWRDQTTPLTAGCFPFLT